MKCSQECHKEMMCSQKKKEATQLSRPVFRTSSGDLWNRAWYNWVPKKRRCEFAMMIEQPSLRTIKIINTNYYNNHKSQISIKIREYEILNALPKKSKRENKFTGKKIG
jgi:hypothetical protein